MSAINNAIDEVSPVRPAKGARICPDAPGPRSRKPAGSRHGIDEDGWNDPPLLNRASQRVLLFQPVPVIPPAPTKRARTESLTISSASKRPTAYGFDRRPSAFMQCAASLEDAADEEDEEDD
jgi:hypothetical protein